MRKLRPSPFDSKFKLSNSGLFYLIVIALSAAVAANAFRKDGSVLLLPIVAVIVLIVATMFLRKRFARGR